jgi:hypothetical protein
MVLTTLLLLALACFVSSQQIKALIPQMERDGYVVIPNWSESCKHECELYRVLHQVRMARARRQMKAIYVAPSRSLTDRARSIAVLSHPPVARSPASIHS